MHPHRYPSESPYNTHSDSPLWLKNRPPISTMVASSIDNQMLTPLPTGSAIGYNNDPILGYSTVSGYVDAYSTEPYSLEYPKMNSHLSNTVARSLSPTKQECDNISILRQAAAVTQTESETMTSLDYQGLRSSGATVCSVPTGLPSATCESAGSHIQDPETDSFIDQDQSSLVSPQAPPVHPVLSNPLSCLALATQRLATPGGVFVRLHPIPLGLRNVEGRAVEGSSTSPGSTNSSSDDVDGSSDTWISSPMAGTIPDVTVQHPVTPSSLYGAFERAPAPSLVASTLYAVSPHLRHYAGISSDEDDCNAADDCSGYGPSRRGSRADGNLADTEPRYDFVEHTFPSNTPDTVTPSQFSLDMKDSGTSVKYSNSKKSRQYLPKARAHVCTICSKIFPRPSGLLTHMNSHTGSKPFKCLLPTCKKTFAVRSNAKRHLRTHGITPPPARSVPQPYIVNFAPPTIAEEIFHTNGMAVAPTGSPPARLRWVPSSLQYMCAKNRSPYALVSDDGPNTESVGVMGTMPVVDAPLPPIRPYPGPSYTRDGGLEERNSFEKYGPYPYHPTYVRTTASTGSREPLTPSNV